MNKDTLSQDLYLSNSRIALNDWVVVKEEELQANSRKCWLIILWINEITWIQLLEEMKIVGPTGTDNLNTQADHPEGSVDNSIALEVYLS